MGDNVPIVRIRAVLMEVPVRRAEVNLHIANDAATVLPDFKDGVPEIGTGFEVPLARTHHPHLASATGGQVLGTQIRVVPNRLDVSLCYRFHSDEGLTPLPMFTTYAQTGTSPSSVWSIEFGGVVGGFF